MHVGRGFLVVLVWFLIGGGVLVLLLVVCNLGVLDACWLCYY